MSGSKPSIHVEQLLKAINRIDLSNPSERRVIYRSLNKLLSAPEQDEGSREALREIRRRWQTYGLWSTPSLPRGQIDTDALLVSFPRAGSNFLQNVITSVFGGTSISMYEAWPDDQTRFRTIKSHAPTPAYLEEECDRHLSTRLANKPCLLLLRDPRDLVISFFEYTQTKLNCKIDQGSFLESTDYFLASTIDLGYQRRSILKPLSIKSAINTFHKTWSKAIAARRRPIATIYFEDWAANPREQADAIASFLHWEPIESRSVSDSFELVSQVSEEPKRPRGRPGSWRLVQEHYSQLLESAHSQIYESIELFENQSCFVGAED